MAKTKKTARKAATRKAVKAKPGAKAKAPARKPAAKTKAKPAAGSKSIKSLLASSRRPPNNPEVPALVIKALNQDLGNVKEALEEYAQHLRSLDRKRLNGVGIKKQGFIERVFMFAEESPEFLPHYLTLEKFREDGKYFLSFRGLVDTVDQIRELLWNITKISSDVWYTDALEYYSPVKEAAKRRVDPAESIYKALEPFFKHSMPLGDDGKPILTKKKALKDAKAINSGKKEGIVEFVNQKPKMIGGIHKVIDKTFKDSEQFKETEEGQITE